VGGGEPKKPGKRKGQLKTKAGKECTGQHRTGYFLLPEAPGAGLEGTGKNKKKRARNGYNEKKENTYFRKREKRKKNSKPHGEKKKLQASIVDDAVEKGERVT